ncbi:hypothetical protein P168DRAFT_285003 [Aspergillus campestris IBT 28561]|uniref:Uncharacterized protein n=1 Tax=Aspergillus campestris (strain IBT 28561) TaxID=1392248 RepID=A0A2I1CT83_ASPC2|nr:uncharacterized protein P168DRAFT_285003 [Aspergillus campestris IBT 28561]PKY00846.1 hypothetical protein P168DRAFT_285003 [Aspergillus campestris IBT 28561]
MRSLLFLLSLTPVLVASAPSSTSAATPNPTVCGDIAKRTSGGVFPARTVYDCLTSVPFNPAVGSRLLKYVNDTIQFHSTLAYLANPPPGYQQPGVDLVAGISQLQRNIDEGAFANEYDFEAALHRLLRAGHDGHLSLAGGILSPFAFGSPRAIASVSLDGKELPKVYFTEDLFAYEASDGSSEPSAIATINSQDVVEYLTEFAAVNAAGKLEPHAEWNMLMQSGALDIQGYYEVFYGGAAFYPGESITYGLENGTVLEPEDWDALYFSPGNTGPLETGGDFYNFFVLNRLPASYTEMPEPPSSSTPIAEDTTSSSAAPAPSPTELPDTAYPREPDVMQPGHSIDNQGLLRGYFLNESSLAVLTIPQFDSYVGKSNSFIDTVWQFLQRSRRAGLRKVVIDLQQNSGGHALLALEIFRLFFPSIDPLAASRRRAHPMADALGSTLTPYWQNLTTNHSAYSTLLTNEWVVASRLDADTGQNFTAWDDYFHSPASYGGDHFTNLERYDPSDRLFASEAADITTDNLNSSHSTQPYQAEDIIILTDGLCSSTCALFTEMMHHEAGVQTVVVGGRPNPGPMQAAGGTRGAASYSARRLDRDISTAQNIDRSTRGQFPDRRYDFFTTGFTINLRDQIRSGDDEESPTPLQFQYEAADCRIFYTPKTWYNYTNLWTYAADAIWSDPGLCVATSTDNHTHPSPHRQPYTVDTTKPGTSKPADNPPQSNDPSNDIFSWTDKFEHYNLRPCNNNRDCAAGGHHSCREVEVCQNGIVKPLKRCLRYCSIGDRSCGDDKCELDRLSRTCNRPMYPGCLDMEPDKEIYKGMFNKQETYWLSVANDRGFDACDLYNEFDYCYTLDGRDSDRKFWRSDYDEEDEYDEDE